MEVTKPIPRAAASDVEVSFGLATIIGKLVPISKRYSPPTKRVCPECSGKTSQQYVCENDHGPFAPGELKTAWVEDEPIVLPPELLEQARQPSVESGKAKLRVFPAHQVERNTYPTGNAWVFYPGRRKNNKGWEDTSSPLTTVLLNLVSDPKYAFLARLNLRTEKLVRVNVYAEHLVFHELTWPEDMHPMADFPTPDVDEKTWKMARDLVEAELEEFDPDEWSDASRVKLREAAEAAARGETPHTEPIKVPEESLDSVLEASLRAKGKK